MRRRASRVAGVALAAVLLGAGCATTPEPAPSPRPAPEADRPAASLGRDFFLQQTLVARFDAQERRFEIALQSRCGELHLVGLTPFGVRLFSAVRGPDGIAVETFAGAKLPFEPERVLRDVERTFFRSEPVRGDADRDVRFAGETVHESWRGGRLVSRRIPTSDDPRDPPLEIRYSGPVGPAGISERVDLSNERFGYALEIHNHHVEELQCGPGD